MTDSPKGKPMTKEPSADRAGSMPDVDVLLIGKAYSAEDKKLVQGAIFYLQEMVRLFPAGTNMSLIATWEHGAAQRETVNLGTLSNAQVIQLLSEVEHVRALQNAEVKGHA